jgi:hypothetical protein
VSAGRRFNAYGGSVTQIKPATVNGKRGIDALRDPATNRSTAFTEAEREWPIVYAPTVGQAGLEFGHAVRLGAVSEPGVLLQRRHSRHRRRH